MPCRSIENIVRGDLAAIVANEIDYQAMVGTGSSNTPKGVTGSGNSTEIESRLIRLGQGVSRFRRHDPERRRRHGRNGMGDAPGIRDGVPVAAKGYLAEPRLPHGHADLDGRLSGRQHHGLTRRH